MFPLFSNHAVNTELEIDHISPKINKDKEYK